ncbi:murein hydrolase activator EnvC family protein [Aquisediminimonas sediminicola]|uniref:murein hydrolase activator EnvC family protein n=1 Tax=Alteraquisediminimonas sediminicola TaxID=2676787 RepID=UPI001C8EC906|nr:peptidoglycan DD-metalloendopeptidase family protein [Aquisediminimonas sediminicola]
MHARALLPFVALGLLAPMAAIGKNTAQNAPILPNGHHLPVLSLPVADPIATMNEHERAARAKAALAARIASAEAALKTGEARVAVIERQRKDQRARLAAHQGGLARLTAALQTLARRPPALAIAQPGSINDIAHVRALLAATLPRIRQQTAGIRAEIARGEQLRLDAALALVALRRTQLTLIDRRDELARMEASLTGGGAPSPREAARALALGERARDALDVIREIDNQQAVLAGLIDLPGPLPRPELSPATTASTSLPIVGLLAPKPVPPRRLPAYVLPIEGALVTGFGEVSDAGVRERGISLLGLPNAEVIAPNRGRIAFAGPFRSYGQIVIIDHGRRWFTLLTGMSVLAVHHGQDVTRGALIGRLGRDQPRLTVELRRAGLPVDLTPLLRRT